MGRRKIFTRTDISTPEVAHLRDAAGTVVIPLEVVPPKVTIVQYGQAIGGGAKQFDFSPWYGVGFDAVTYACQRQIERLLRKQDREVEATTVRSYCEQGLRGFFTYLRLRRLPLEQDLSLVDIDRDAIDGYLGFLRDAGIATVSQKNNYSLTKAVLKALCQRGIIKEVSAGDRATFPRNPFPGSEKTKRGQAPLPKAQRNAFAAAVKEAVMPLYRDDIEPTSELLAFALLIIALHTGRNTWPLLEMSRDCLREHPKEGTLFLVLHKRRGHSTSKVALREGLDHDLSLESLSTLRPTVASLIQRAILLSDRLRSEAPEHLRDRVWLYRMQTAGRGVGAAGKVSALNDGTLAVAIGSLVNRYALTDPGGKPLRINISRLRKTFVNRIFEILDGDLATTAIAAGNTARVVDASYLRPGEDASKNWRFMGMALVEELLTNSIGATERTPLGHCTDNKNGDFAPKRDGAVCISFLNCLRCRNYVVTADDLYRLFSFYWRLLRERAKMDPKRWKKRISHIVRLIDQDVIAVGIKNGAFKVDVVNRERARAQVNPHPFWRDDTILADLAAL